MDATKYEAGFCIMWYVEVLVRGAKQRPVPSAVPKCGSSIVSVCGKLIFPTEADADCFREEGRSSCLFVLDFMYCTKFT